MSIEQQGPWVVLIVGVVMALIAAGATAIRKEPQKGTLWTFIFAFLLTGMGLFGLEFFPAVGGQLDKVANLALAIRVGDPAQINESMEDLAELFESGSASEQVEYLTSAVLSDAIRSGSLPDEVRPVEFFRQRADATDSPALEAISTEVASAAETYQRNQRVLAQSGAVSTALRQLETQPEEQIGAFEVRSYIESQVGEGFSLEQYNQDLEIVQQSLESNR